MAIVVTIACALIALPIANYMVHCASPRDALLFYVGVMLPMWTSYLVKVYAWRLILAKQGVLNWLLESLRIERCARCHAGRSFRRRAVALLVLSRHVHRIRLHVAAVHDPASRGGAGASAGLAAPGVRGSRRASGSDLSHRDSAAGAAGLAAGSVFAFSLTLGDYIIPSVVGAPGYFIGMMVYVQQGTAGNLPLAAAFSVVPIVLIMIYLALAKRAGAFDAL